MDIIIPVKTPLNAKKRLAGVLTQHQRAQLVLAMLADVLLAIGRVPAATAWVVGADASVAALARRHNARLVAEPRERGYNAAVRTGIAAISDHYPCEKNVAVVPGDIPLVTTNDIEKLSLETDRDTRLVRLAPSADENGTNGLFLSHTSLLAPAFGADSFHRYCNSANALELNTEILRSSTMARDIDTPADLQYLLAMNLNGETGRYLRTSSIRYDTPQSNPTVIESAG